MSYSTKFQDRGGFGGALVWVVLVVLVVLGVLGGVVEGAGGVSVEVAVELAGGELAGVCVIELAIEGDAEHAPPDPPWRLCLSGELHGDVGGVQSDSFPFHIIGTSPSGCLSQAISVISFCIRDATLSVSPGWRSILG